MPSPTQRIDLPLGVEGAPFRAILVRRPTPVACHPVSGCKRAGPFGDTTFAYGGLPLIRPITCQARTPRYPRKSGRPPGRRRWHGKAIRPTPACVDGVDEASDRKPMEGVRSDPFNSILKNRPWFISSSNMALTTAPFPLGMVGRFPEAQFRAQHERPGFRTAQNRFQRRLRCAF
jgi:hypothetical protein